MTERQILVAQALGRCSMLPGTSDKRFVKDMERRAYGLKPAELTERQAANLERLAWRFRRQMPSSLVPETAC